MKITIRADASTKMGSGHVMRCLTLAELLREKGASVTFITRKYDGNLNGLISKKGFHVLGLNKTVKSKIDKTENLNISDDYKEWLGVGESRDAEDTIHAIGDEKPDWLIVDHYSLSEKWEKTIRPCVKNIMVIDDLANRHHDCDLLVDQNWFENIETRYDGLIPTGCTKLLGPKYALLRPEFAEARKSLKQRNGIVDRIFIFFGGSDLHNLTAMTLRALSLPELDHLHVDVVIGENNPHRDEIQQLTESRNLTHLHVQVDDMVSIMVKADLAVASGGVNTWERMCLDLFSMVITTANNQIPTIENLNAHRHVKFLGDHKKVNQSSISAHINEYVYNMSEIKRNKMLIDGLGTNRVSKLLSNNMAR